MRVSMPIVGIREGDRFVTDDKTVWTAVTDAAEGEDGGVVIRVQFVDGGIEPRYWSDGDAALEIERDV